MWARVVFLALGPALAANPLGPGAGTWTVETPEANGLNTADVEAAVDHVMESREVRTRECMLIIKDGALIYERYRTNGYKDTAHQGMSMTKTLGALIVGWAHDHGFLDIDKNITAYGVKSPKSYEVTARQIMSQSLAGKHGPGEAWSYDALGKDWVNTLPLLVKASTGRPVAEIWEEEFVKPLGLSDEFSWAEHGGVNTQWAAGSMGTCRDYARVGQLLLNEGKWPGAEGGSIVSADYVREMHTPQTRYPPYTNYSNPCYGLLTWLNTNPGGEEGSDQYPGVCQMWPERSWFPAGSADNAYLAAGFKGQETMVIPNHNMVLVSMGDTQDDYPLQRVLYEAVCKMFPQECTATIFV